MGSEMHEDAFFSALVSGPTRRILFHGSPLADGWGSSSAFWRQRPADQIIEHLATICWLLRLDTVEMEHVAVARTDVG